MVIKTGVVMAMAGAMLGLAQEKPPAAPVQPAATAVPPSAAAPAPPEKAAPTAQEVHDQLVKEAAALRGLVRSSLSHWFLKAVEALPLVEARTVWRDREKGIAYSESEYAKLSDPEREGLKARPCDAQFFYYTGYGSPLVYVRVLEAAEAAGLVGLHGKRVMDFGYGSIGQLRVMASMGADVTGIEVEPVLAALYGEAGDTGEVARHGGEGAKGKLRVLLGQWPAEEALVKAAAEGGAYDLITSKNTLKRGYIHPAREADPKRLVHLGVDDETFVKKVYDSLRPGGLFVIYNISPAQAPADKPYIPHADGECPFAREVFEKSGFEVVEFDKDDTRAVLDVWAALGYDNGKSREEMAKDLRAWVTVVRRPAPAR